MPLPLPAAPFLPASPPPAPPPLAVAAFSYDDRRHILPALSEALTLNGCWLLDRKALSATQVELRFEVELRSVVDLYAALIAAGLELTRGAHLELTGLCTLRKHRNHSPGIPSLVTVCLSVSFLDDDALPVIMPAAAGRC